MKNKNFDSISKFSVPQSWIDAAKNVPNTNKKKAVVVIGFKRYLQAAACLVTVIGLTLLVLFMRENEVKPRPSMQNTTTNSQTTTAEDGTSDDTSSTQATDGNNKDYFDRLPIIIETTPDGTVIIRPTKPQGSIDPSKPTVPSIVGPTMPSDKTEEPTAEPTEPPTNAPTTKPWYPVDPTDEPTAEPWYPIEPTEPWYPPPTEEPWYPVDPTEPWYPIDPTEPPTEPPTTPPTKPPVIEPTDPPNISPDKIRLIAKVRVLKSDLKGNYNIYCKVYNHRSEFCGDPSLYSQQHKVYIIPDDNPRYVTLYYEVKRADLGVYDSYKFIFYNSSGEVVSATLRYTIY